MRMCRREGEGGRGRRWGCSPISRRRISTSSSGYVARRRRCLRGAYLDRDVRCDPSLRDGFCKASTPDALRSPRSWPWSSTLCGNIVEMTLRIDPALLLALRRRAKREGRSVPAEVVRLIRKELEDVHAPARRKTERPRTMGMFANFAAQFAESVRRRPRDSAPSPSHGAVILLDEHRLEPSAAPFLFAAAGSRL